jgi:hypothetical protein
MRHLIFSTALLLSLISTGHAHHGVAGLGAAGLEGPGAPIESATSATLPEGKFLTYLKLDHARYEKFDDDPSNPESDYADYWLAGLGYGFTPWLSAYIFLPYHHKIDEPGGYDTSGFADMSVFGQLGFKYDDGLKLIPSNESLDELEDWHMTVFGGFTIPTGDPDLRDSNGDIDPGKSTGFGEPAFSLGFTATKMLTDRTTYNVELSGIWFQEHTYADGNSTQFGDELRFNNAAIYRAWTSGEKRQRLDLAVELQYLGLGRDITNNVEEVATGGEILYFVPGIRYYWGNVSAAVGIKTPIWTDLNEEDQQQGGEGTEEYRFIFTLSALF